MGSYQRDWSDKVEKDISNKYNIHLTDNNFSICDAFDKTTKSTFEIKASSTENFKFHTLANIGQNSLTDYGIFKCISWKDFRLKEFEIEKKGISGSLSMREIRDNHPSKKQEIEVIALKDKLEYIQVLKEAEIDSKSLKVFLLNCILGTCKKKCYNYNILENELKDSNFILVNSLLEDKIINKKSLLKDIELDSLKVKFEEGLTSIKVTDGNSDILRISFHWKNKFQGGETPCLNIFLSSKFNGLLV